ncbi:hypothetical protein EIP91_000397 [Steccherinum ochraceum]|uniref:Uncharacterized protein n=1 Tax=Steccherinum ochraceum TaxID=92696 RepID=A0A4R0RG13_9APHY|nr:hypothetical protein EIP91_000397 [Steccherinum ochraceum]
MSDLLSISLFQLLSVLSFLTSVVAVFRMGAGFHRLQQFKFDSGAPATVSQPVTRPWSWSGLPTVSFSINALIGEDEEVQRDAERELSVPSYSAGTELVRMNWRAEKSMSTLPPLSYAQPPLSMAKLIMSRHTHRKPYRIPRRSYGSSRPTASSRLTQPVV